MSLHSQFQSLNLLSSIEGKIETLLVAIPYFLNNRKAYIEILIELATELNTKELIILVELEYETPNKIQQIEIKNIKEVKQDVKLIFDLCSKEREKSYYSIWQQDTFLLAYQEANTTRFYLVESDSDLNGKYIAKNLTDSFSEYNYLNSSLYIKGGNILVANDFVLIGKDEIGKNGFSENEKKLDKTFEEEFERLYGNRKHLIPVTHVDSENTLKDTKLDVQPASNMETLIKKDSVTLKHIINQWAAVEQPIFHLDIFITLAGCDNIGNQLIIIGKPEVGCNRNKLDKNTRNILDTQINDAKVRIDNCIKNLEYELKKHKIKYRILRNPLPLTFRRIGNEVTWYWASYNNCLVEAINSEEKKVWLPSYGTCADPRNPHWKYLEKYDKESVILFKKQGFKTYIFKNNFHFLAAKCGSLRCITKCLHRSL